MNFVGMKLIRPIYKESKINDFDILLEKTNRLLQKIKHDVGFYESKCNMIK